MLMEDDVVETEFKDRGIIHFDGSPDAYDPDNDPGFVVCQGKPVFNVGSVMEVDDHAAQQSVFDRLPIPQSKRAEFYQWLVTEGVAEQEEQRIKDSKRNATKKRKTREPPATPRSSPHRSLP